MFIEDAFQHIYKVHMFIYYPRIWFFPLNTIFLSCLIVFSKAYPLENHIWFSKIHIHTYTSLYIILWEHSWCSSFHQTIRYTSTLRMTLLFVLNAIATRLRRLTRKAKGIPCAFSIAGPLIRHHRRLLFFYHPCLSLSWCLLLSSLRCIKDILKEFSFMQYSFWYDRNMNYYFNAIVKKM